MKSKVYSSDKLTEINRDICLVLQRYVALLDKAYINKKTREELLPHYKEKLEVIKQSNYEDKVTPIN